MTSLCAGNGPSQPVPGTPQVQTFLAGALSDFLVAEGMGWAAALGAGLGVLSFDLNTFCATDPPPLPTIDAARIAGYFNPLNPLGASQLNSDFNDLVGHFLWFKTCQCVSGSQPAPPPAVTQPTGYQTDNPQLTSPTGTACFQGPQAFAQNALDAAGNATIGFTGTNSIPAQATWAQCQTGAWQGPGPATPAPFDITLVVNQVQGSAIVNRQVTTIPAGGPSSGPTLSFNLVPGGGTWSATAHAAGQTGGQIGVFLDLQDFCGSPPSSTLAPCCPPDPTLENMIAQVIRLEQQILAQLGGTRTYTRGTAHLALSGSGTLSVAGLRGIAIDVVQGTPTTPLLQGVPPYQWNLGWVSMSDGGGMLQEQRITRQHQIWLPTDGELGTTVGYFLLSGIVANITELNPA